VSKGDYRACVKSERKAYLRNAKESAIDDENVNATCYLERVAACRIKRVEDEFEQKQGITINEMMDGKYRAADLILALGDLVRGMPKLERRRFLYAAARLADGLFFRKPDDGDGDGEEEESSDESDKKG